MKTVVELLNNQVFQRDVLILSLAIVSVFFRNRAAPVLSKNLIIPACIISVVNLIYIETSLYNPDFRGLLSEMFYIDFQFNADRPWIIIFLIIQQALYIICIDFHLNTFGKTSYSSNNILIRTKEYFLENNINTSYKLIKIAFGVVNYYAIWAISWHLIYRIYISYANLLFSVFYKALVGCMNYNSLFKLLIGKYIFNYFNIHSINSGFRLRDLLITLFVIHAVLFFVWFVWRELNTTKRSTQPI